jgi:hypothetical protein
MKTRRRFISLLIFAIIITILCVGWRVRETRPPCMEMLYTEVCTQPEGHAGHSPHISDDTIWDHGEIEREP